MWKQLIGAIAGLGVPGLVLLVVMSASGFAGAAALTTALAALGGPFGMLGGIFVLGVLALMAKGLAEYGLDAIFEAVVDQLVRTGRSLDQIIEEVRAMPIVPEDIKAIIIPMLNKRRSSNLNESDGNDCRPILVSPVSRPSTGQVIFALDPASGAQEDVLITQKMIGIHAECLISERKVFAWHITWGDADRILFSPTRNLKIESTYRLEQNKTGKEVKVTVVSRVVEGCWLGKSEEAGSGGEMVLIVRKKR